MLRTLAHRLRWLPACVVGLAAFLVVVGPRVLDPTNLAWVRDHSDSFTHYLGWAFFRNAPWSLPLGRNPNYGLELSVSVLYTDSIPLLAIPFKLLSPWLPDPFQYSGPWLLACFVLQALFAWMLVGLATGHPALRLAGCVLFVFAPPMLFRLGGHWALVGHWIVLAALYLALRPGRRWQTTSAAVLALTAALVHTYLLAMVLAVWVAAWAGDAWRRTRPPGALARELVVVPAGCLLALWQAGLFLVGEGKSTSGFGNYRMNLNTLVNPYGWSFVLPTLPWKPADYEGFAFIGLGGLLAAAAAVPAAIRLHRQGGLGVPRQWWPLGLALLGLTVFAASNRVGLGLRGFEYRLPAGIEPLAGMLRSSGRMFWPVFYVLLLAAVSLIVRGYRTGVSLAVLTTVALVQVVDTSAGWKTLQPQFRKRAAVRSFLISGFWHEAPALYRRVRLVPPGNLMQNWSVIAGYAQRHGLSTDAIYSARVDQDRAAALARETTARLATGDLEPDTFYILQGGTARHVPCAIDPARDQLAWVDGFWVLMPGWKVRHGDRFAGQLRLECPVLSADTPALAVVADSAAVAALSSGWSVPEPWGTWSLGPRSLLTLHIRGRAPALEFTLSPFLHAGPPLRVRVSVDGQPRGIWLVADPGRRAYRVSLPAATAAADARRVVRIRLEYSDTWSPTRLRQSQRSRELAVALHQVRLVGLGRRR